MIKEINDQKSVIKLLSNNKNAVHFNAYSRVNAYNRVVDNISYFSECTFSVDEHAYFSVDTQQTKKVIKG